MRSSRASFGIVAAAIAIASSAAACGAQSDFTAEDEGAAGEAMGGTGSGGASPLGGTTSAGSGGIVTGTGGAPSCTECPPADYGLVVEGDGEPFTLRYAGSVDAASDRAGCPDTPLRGTVGGCGRSIAVSACLDPLSGRPCLEIDGALVRYVDRQRGELFTGFFTSDVPSEAAPGVETGTIEVELSSDTGRTLVLTIRYTFCATALTNLRVVC